MVRSSLPCGGTSYINAVFQNSGQLSRSLCFKRFKFYRCPVGCCWNLFQQFYRCSLFYHEKSILLGAFVVIMKCIGNSLNKFCRGILWVEWSVSKIISRTRKLLSCKSHTRELKKATTFDLNPQPRTLGVPRLMTKISTFRWIFC